MKPIQVFFVVVALLASANGNAFFFIFPIPNGGKPEPLKKIIAALDKSTDTRALAYASEDKTFDSVTWVWACKSGQMSQEDADRMALEECEQSLAAARSETAGGKPLYDFGKKRCVLHAFSERGKATRAGTGDPAANAKSTSSVCGDDEAKGSSCVSESAKVGDFIQMPDGSRGVIKTLSGKSSGCRNNEFPVRADIDTSGAGLPPVPEARTYRTSILLPAGWVGQPITDDEKSKGIFFYALNRKMDVGLVLGGSSRAGIIDMGIYAQSVRANQASLLVDSQQGDITKLEINGRPGWRFEVTGSGKNGVRVTHMLTILETEQTMVIVNAWTSASTFEARKPVLEKLPELVKVESASAATEAVKQPAGPPAVPVSPAPASPI